LEILKKKNPAHYFLEFENPKEVQEVKPEKIAYVDKFVVSELGTTFSIGLGLLSGLSKLLRKLTINYCFILIHEQYWLANYFPLQLVNGAKMIYLDEKFSLEMYQSDLKWGLFYMEVNEFSGLSMKNTRRASVVSFDFLKDLPKGAPLRRTHSTTSEIQYQNPNEKEVTISDVPYPIFLLVVEFLYTDFVQTILDIDDFAKVLLNKAAQYFQLTRLADFCHNEGVLYPSTLFKHLGTFVGSNQYADIEFLIEGQTVPGHRVILSSRCQYFCAMLSSGMKEAHMKQLPMEVSILVFNNLLTFLYTNQLDFNPETIWDLFQLSNLYEIAALQIKCENEMIWAVDEDTIVPMFQASKLYQAHKLQHRCLEQLCEKYAQNYKIIEGMYSSLEESDFLVIRSSLKNEIAEYFMNYCKILQLNK